MWNVALMAYHIWSIITSKRTLWVKWIHTYRLHDHNFWEMDNVASASWGWRKILSIRTSIRQYIVHVVGNGSSTAAWHDTWSDFGYLSEFITAREIHRANWRMDLKVADLFDMNGWTRRLDY
ncbi:uncharacterized protein [Rutidosis leptorrhynchoides]|uniref:uncharacterized protein n=1 Tax=Rutidosis leptorrhynchoides TaxID=125765 RepID=UPI003A9A4F38